MFENFGLGLFSVITSLEIKVETISEKVVAAFPSCKPSIIVEIIKKHLGTSDYPQSVQNNPEPSLEVTYKSRPVIPYHKKNITRLFEDRKLRAISNLFLSLIREIL